MPEHRPFNSVVTKVSKRRSRCSVSSQAEPCDFSSLGVFKDCSGKVGHVEVTQCRRCGLAISLPPISDVSFLYAGRKSQDFQRSESNLVYKIKRIAFRRQARALLGQIGRRSSRTLDFGCGSGLFTRCLSDLVGTEGVVYGSDFEAVPPHDLLDRPYVALDNLAHHAGTFDVVLAMHVLEHDDDTEGLLNRISSMIKPGGLVVIEVPNVNCIWTKIFGKSWDAWYTPYHRSHFSRLSLRGLFHSQGLIIREEMDICVPTIGRSLSNLLGGNKGIFWFLLGILGHPIQWSLEKMSGRPSALRFIAEKASL